MWGPVREYLLACGEEKDGVVTSPEPVTLVYNSTLEMAVGRDPFRSLFQALMEIPEFIDFGSGGGDLFVFRGGSSLVLPALCGQLFHKGRPIEFVYRRLSSSVDHLKVGDSPDPYEVAPNPPLVTTDVGFWLNDLSMFLSEGEKATGYRDVFFRKTVLPMARAQKALERGDKTATLAEVRGIRRDDWRIACENWLALGA